MSIKENKTINDKWCSAWSQGCALYEKWASNYGIGYYELLIFYALDLNGEMTQKAIADYYAIPKQSINGIIRPLKQKGYIRLEESNMDKREKKVVMTEAGIAYAKTFLEPLYQMERHIFQYIGKDRIEQMIETISLFSILFEKEMNKK